MNDITISKIIVDEKWTKGYNAHITITNKSTNDLENWYLTLNLKNNFKWISNVTVQRLSSTTLQLNPEPWISKILKNQSIQIGFGVESNEQPSKFELYTNMPITEPDQPIDNTLPPGKKYNLANWKLQLPIATTKSVQEIFAPELAGGYTSEYFYTANDGSIAFACPSNGATTPNSNNPRSELREMRPNGEWSLSGKHELIVECAVINLSPKQKGVIIGQIHGDNNDLNPQLCKMYWGVDNKLTCRIKNDSNPSSKQDTNLVLGQYKLSEKITFSISIVDGTITASVTNIKDGKPKTVTKTSKFKNKYWYQQKYYFKVGNYYQINNKEPVDSSLVHCYSITTTHTD